LFQFTYIGAPMIYYGDEAGINSPSLANSGSGFPEDDPYNRAPYPWADEAGNQNVYGPSDASMIAYYRSLGIFRQNNPALRTGSFTPVVLGDLTASQSDNNTFAFVRADAARKLLVVMNNGTASNTVTIPVGAFYADGTVLYDAFVVASLAPSATFTVSGGTVTITLPPRTGTIFSDLAPTSADVSLSGRVADPKGQGISGVAMTLTDSRGTARIVWTNSFGFYRFDDVRVGEVYTIFAQGRKHRIADPSRVISITDEVTGLDFTVEE
jgi:hypothetical protein